MPIQLRKPERDELDTASKLCLRSKAYWGYDRAFLDACVEELTLTETDLETGHVTIAVDDQGLAGVAHVAMDAEGCFLEKLFVDPDRMGEGIGRALFDWSVEAARGLAADTLIIEADPGAVPFYLKLGGVEDGWASSGSIPGRKLPRLVYRL
ncbi:MAG: GNAT family N-acetyltransferase [Pseudomonadota bacterium]